MNSLVLYTGTCLILWEFMINVYTTYVHASTMHVWYYMCMLCILLVLHTGSCVILWEFMNNVYTTVHIYYACVIITCVYKKISSVCNTYVYICECYKGR